MENSPPGIHTIPSGAGPGAADALETVGMKSSLEELTDDIGAFESVGAGLWAA
jgi:hypothetical protein